jgi:AraC family transcriptional regulator, transcriptional activator of pobA
MAKRFHPESLYDPRKDGQALRMRRLSEAAKPLEPARTNYFTIYRIRSGSGTFWADTAQHQLARHALLFFVPYQHIRLCPETPLEADVIQFHANFLCVETFHAEVGCSGVLFNDPYGSPVVALDAAARREVSHLIDRMRQEQADCRLAYNDVSLSYLKVLLILATRLKSSAGSCPAGVGDARHPVVGQLRELIERNYATLHAPADYAALLHMTPRTLGRVVREQLGTTLTNLLQARILTHAKWQMLHTLKSVKEVAREVGFSDELYFSRLFKKGTGVSPTFFREFETEIRGGSNLSMLSASASISSRHSETDDD